ncbi:MAG: hypothetical protein Q9167_006211 [Letrouitia subvulpina]
MKRCQEATMRLLAVVNRPDNLDGNLVGSVTSKLDNLQVDENSVHEDGVDGGTNADGNGLGEDNNKHADKYDDEEMDSDDSSWDFKCRGLDPVLEGGLSSILYPNVSHDFPNSSRNYLQREGSCIKQMYFFDADKPSDTVTTKAEDDSKHEGSYLYGQREEPKSGDQSSSDLMSYCFYCNDVGHTVVNCEQLRHETSSRNATTKGLPKISSEMGGIKERVFSKELTAEEDSEGMVTNKHLLGDAFLEQALLNDCNSPIQQTFPSPENRSQGNYDESTYYEALSEEFGDSSGPEDDVTPYEGESDPMEL